MLPGDRESDLAKTNPFNINSLKMRPAWRKVPVRKKSRSSLEVRHFESLHCSSPFEADKHSFYEHLELVRVEVSKIPLRKCPDGHPPTISPVSPPPLHMHLPNLQQHLPFPTNPPRPEIEPRQTLPSTLAVAQMRRPKKKSRDCELPHEQPRRSAA